MAAMNSRGLLSFALLPCFSLLLHPTLSANDGVIEDYMEEQSQQGITHSGLQLLQAFTVQFGTCKFPENFTGCQGLANQKKVPFISENIELECEGKDKYKYKCGSNVFWKW
ncbi:hypothetical protein LIER_17911 [Lithospermum erythrorhizon]|uniref:Uncharacterized protein n=1 Tax=Lithospermum erythrorhizon TaxID=34254 RepID=A0AAV3QEU8_LITER